VQSVHDSGLQDGYAGSLVCMARGNDLGSLSAAQFLHENLNTLIRHTKLTMDLSW